MHLIHINWMQTNSPLFAIPNSKKPWKGRQASLIGTPDLNRHEAIQSLYWSPLMWIFIYSAPFTADLQMCLMIGCHPWPLGCYITYWIGPRDLSKMWKFWIPKTLGPHGFQIKGLGCVSVWMCMRHCRRGWEYNGGWNKIKVLAVMEFALQLAKQ